MTYVPPSWLDGFTMAEHSGVTEGSVSVGGEDTRQSLILAGLKLF